LLTIPSKAELADGIEHFVTVAISILDVLDALARFAQSQRNAFLRSISGWRRAVTREKKIEASATALSSAIQPCRMSKSATPLSDKQTTSASEVPEDEPLPRQYEHSSQLILGEEPHATVADMYLQPVAIMFQLVRPTGIDGRLADHGGAAWLNESCGNTTHAIHEWNIGAK
jgi:hypothetical protein